MGCQRKFEKSFTFFWLVFLVTGIVIGQSQEGKTQEEPAGSQVSTPRQREANIKLEFGMDITSRQIWRGMLVAQSPTILPYLVVKAGGFSGGIKTLYPLSGEMEKAVENDFFVAYEVGTKIGRFSVTCFDIYKPNQNDDFFNFAGDGTGSHLLDLRIRYFAPESVPLRCLLSLNIHNDPDNSVYFEAGYTFRFKPIPLEIFAGIAKGDSDWYGIQGAEWQVINVGFQVSRNIQITREFTLPVKGVFMLNPYAKRSYFAVVFSL